VGAIAFLLLSFSWVYRRVVAGLVRDWWFDDNYSHGFLIVPIALYFVWESRHSLRAAAVRPSMAGLVGLFGSIGLLVAGVLGAELFVSRISLIAAVAAVVVFVAGWQVLRILAFPLAFLLLMVPIPAIIFNQIAFPLQLLASRAGELALSALQVPVLREGNIIVLANTTLEVAEACSGIRSLISLLTLGIVLGHFADPRTWTRTLIALATIPVAVVANGLRVAGTGIAAQFFGPAAAEGFFHTFSGWLVFVFAFSLLFVIQRAVTRVAPAAPRAASAVAPAA
jgi:exosortase